MVITLLIVMFLGWWALQLMEQAYQRQEFSRMLAGMLVVLSAAGVLTTYLFLDDYIAFVMQPEMLTQQASLDWIYMVQ